MTSSETRGDGVYVVGLGASTPIGRNAWSAAAAVRAGISGFSEHPLMVDTVGEPMRIARAPWLDATVPDVDRCRELLFAAIDEALLPLERVVGRGQSRVGLALALPPPRPGRTAALPQALTRAIAERYPRAFAAVVTFEVGHAAGHLGVDAVTRSLGAGSTDAGVVAGVDSYLSPDTLEWIERCDQLHGAGPLNNAWGFIPGEAAGALLLAGHRLVERTGVEPVGEIAGAGTAREENLIKTGTVCTGEGLTQAFRAALAGLAGDERVDDVFCDLNGETYRADEYGFTALRLKEHFRSATDFVAPADCWGDVGAASAPLHLLLAAVAQRKQYAKGRVSMAWASSESGERGATIVRALT